MRRTETFRLQHDELAHFADRIEGALAGDVRASADAMRALAIDFVQVLTHHARQEDERLYPMLFQHADAAVRTKARALHDEFGVIYAVVEVFVGVWTRAGAIEAEPARFVAEARPLLAGLRARIARENDELYAMIDAL